MGIRGGGSCQYQPGATQAIARGFARHMASQDSNTEIPPRGVVPSRQRWRPPFIYSQADVAALMAQARAMRWRPPPTPP